MNLQIVDAAQVASLLPMSECIDAMAMAMSAVSRGSLSMPARLIMPLVDESGYFAVMPGSLASPKVYGAKIVSLNPANPAKGRPAIQGFVALFDHDTGRPVALLDGAAITALRTAAASGLATRLLARHDAATLGLFGCGVQATSHLEAICAVREIREVRVFGRSQDKARAFARANAGNTPASIVAVADPRHAAECDVVCTITDAKEPILLGEWMRPGAHVNLVGAHTPTAREADTALIARGRVYVDSLAAAWREAGDLLSPFNEGVIDRRHVVGEIGNVLLGDIGGRTSVDDITVYKSLGVIAQDLVAAHTAYRNLLSR